jgi:hypothetical protein
VNRPARRLVAFVVLALCNAACSAGAAREAGTLVAAVDRYRRLEGSAKEAQAKAVADAACSDAQVCDAKQACVAAIDSTMRALALKDEVTARLADLQSNRLAPTAPEAQALPDKLDEAERLLRAGRDRMAECEKKLTDLRAKYRL